jgi:polyhydroxybutyrate depolymerase
VVVVVIASIAVLVSVGAASIDGTASTHNGEGATVAGVTSSRITATMSPGCGPAPVPGPRDMAAATTTTTANGDVLQSLPVGAVSRTYRLAVPTRYRPSSPTPLILLFHGSGSNALETSIYTQLPSRASHAGFLVASPDAEAKQWEISLPGAHTNDLAFIAALITDLSARYCIDRSRVYAAGFSLGSEFSAIAACTSGNRIAAIGLVAAEFLLRPCIGPIPVIAFHGTNDPLVPFYSGQTGASFPGVPVIGVEQNLANWARLDGCRPVAAQARPASMIMRQTWTGCTHGGAVILYTVEGGGHAWPGSPVTLPVGTFGRTTRQIDATSLMIRFFERKGSVR